MKAAALAGQNPSLFTVTIMGMVEDIFEKEDEEERRHQELLQERHSSGGHDSVFGGCAAMLPIWAAGVLSFIWASVMGTLPWDAEGPERSTFKEAVRGLFWLGALASAVIGLLLLMALGLLGVQWMRRDKSGAAAADSPGQLPCSRMS